MVTLLLLVEMTLRIGILDTKKNGRPISIPYSLFIPFVRRPAILSR